jgi:two-component system LytT family sensor kinase
MSRLLYSLFSFEKTNKVNLFVVIGIHVLGWCLFFSLTFLFYPVRFDNNHFWVHEIVGKLFPVGLFYLNYYFLLPRFFESKKYLIYFSLILVTILIVFVQDIIVNRELQNRHPFFIRGVRRPFERRPGEGFFFLSEHDSVRRLYPSDSALKDLPPMPFREPHLFNIPRGIFLMSLNRTGSLCVFLILFGGMIRLAFSYIKNQNEKKLLENINLNTEISFLKSQINPHFLFNTLNGIYSLAHVQSPQTETAILKLSDLMRYVLYECPTEKVELAKDIQYISNYIDLQRLRLSSKVTIQYELKGNFEGHYIAPLLLISFIENAFKHGISYTNSSFIQIEIGVFEETLTLFVENPVVKNNSFEGGMGLKNARRRLELLYPEKHSLNIFNNDYLHIANLKLSLRND